MKDCNACGKCCIKYGGGDLSASPDDLALWASFRPDIEAYVNDGEIWFEPGSKTLLDRCPWLKADPTSSTRYLCDVYLDRPEDCRAYPRTISDMVRDECEMMEAHDYLDLKQAATRLKDRSN